jgi:hypothetical protein
MALSNVIVLVVGGVAELGFCVPGLRALRRSWPGVCQHREESADEQARPGLETAARQSCHFAVVVWRCGPSIVTAPRAGLAGGGARLLRLCLTLTTGPVSGRRARAQTWLKLECLGRLAPRGVRTGRYSASWAGRGPCPIILLAIAQSRCCGSGGPHAGRPLTWTAPCSCTAGLWLSYHQESLRSGRAHQPGERAVRWFHYRGDRSGLDGPWRARSRFSRLGEVLDCHENTYNRQICEG